MIGSVDRHAQKEPLGSTIFIGSDVDVRRTAEPHRCACLSVPSVFGFHKYPKKEGKCYFLINLFLFFAKLHIHKSTFSKKTPCFYVFQKEMELYFKLITKSANEKAIKTIDLCNMYNLVV